MEVGAQNIDSGHVLIGNDDTLWIRVFIEFTTDFQTCIGGGCADQIDDDAVADEWFGTPIHADEREQTVLDLIPFAGARRQMVNIDLHTEFIGEFLQLVLPQSHA